MHLGSNNVVVSKVGLAARSASDGPYMDTYLVRRTEGASYSVYILPVAAHTGLGTTDSSESGSMQVMFIFTSSTLVLNLRIKDRDREDSWASDDAEV